MYKEYASTPITIAELAAKWGIGEKTVRRYIYNARMQAGREENKPKRSKKSHNLTDDQIRECGRRRENGERTADLAAEMGVSRHVLKAEILRVYGRTRASKSVLTPELRAELIACYKRGDRTREIVQRYHISSHTLTEVLVDAGIAMRDGHPRRGIMTHEVAARIEFPRLAKWLEDNDMGLVGLAAYLDTPLPRLRRWLLAGDGEFITKGTIDGLLELTELGYDELFARGSRE